MKTPIYFLTLALMSLAFASCTTAKKNRTAGQNVGVANLLAAAEPISEAEIQSLKAIADSPSSMLPANPDSPHTVPLVAESESIPEPSGEKEEPVPTLKWRRPGLNPDEVNPGDIFSENAGPVLRKALSLADELPFSERRSLLNHYTTIKTARVPMKISSREIDKLQSLAGAETPLPDRSVAFDFRSESRMVAQERLEDLFSQLGRSETINAIENKEHQSRLNAQIASVKKRLQSGERLYVVTAITESEGVTASYPGGAMEDSDAVLIANTLRARFPHLDSIQATRKGNDILITGNPRILWEFETSEILLKDNRIVIDTESIAQR